MPYMDGFKLLEHVGLEMDLPVIMMSVDGETSRVMKGVQHGACDYLPKPIRMKELQNTWQHVLRKKIHEVKEIENQDVNEEIQNIKNGSVDFEYRKPFNGTDISSLRKRKDVDGKEQTDKNFLDMAAAKKARVIWSVDLHQKFVNAVNQIGFDKVGPKKILDLMNVPGLARENVASHLQVASGVVFNDNISNLDGNSRGQTEHAESSPQSWFNLLLATMLENVPSRPAIALENALICRVLERVTSFKGGQIGTRAFNSTMGGAADLARRQGGCYGGFVFMSFLVGLDAILWLLTIGAAVNVLKVIWGRFVTS